MDVWISYAAFNISTLAVVTYWPRGYVTISFMWLFELTIDICIAYCDIHLPSSYLFPLLGYLICLWMSELPKKHLIYYYCGHLTWKTNTKSWLLGWLNENYERFSYTDLNKNKTKHEVLLASVQKYFSGGGGGGGGRGTIEHSWCQIFDSPYKSQNFSDLYFAFWISNFRCKISKCQLYFKVYIQMSKL